MSDPMIISLKERHKRADVTRDPSLVVSLKSKAPVVVENRPVAIPSPTQHESITRRPRRIPAFVPLLIAVIVLLLVTGIVASIANTSASRSSNPAQVSQSEIDTLVAHVGKLVLLPQGESPTLATVTDLHALSGQAFFANAALGDKVLMYPKAQQAVLYDPSEDKVIRVAPLTVQGK